MKRVTINCNTPNSKIYYTLDGSEPSELSFPYSSQFEVEPPVTVKARAFREGILPSDIAEFLITNPMFLIGQKLADGTFMVLGDVTSKTLIGSM